MLRVLPLVIVIGLALYAFFDVLSTDKRQLRSLGKGTWLIVALIPVIGVLLWFFLGRPARSAGGGRPRPSGPPRPPAPDDDPAFLRRLDEITWRAKRASRNPPPPADPAAQAPQPHPSPGSNGDGASAKPEPAKEDGAAEVPAQDDDTPLDPPASEEEPTDPRSSHQP
jgi:hypothetical protein